MWYLCGLGSNIDPYENMSRAVAHLARDVGAVRLSRVISTSPHGIHSQHDFLNALILVASPLAPVSFKEYLNSLEASMGRDRNDPLRSVKDREIDIDILDHSDVPKFSGHNITEPYFRELLNVAAVNNSAIRTLVLEGSRLGEAPTTIYWDHSAGYKVIVSECNDLFDNAIESALSGQ